MLSPAITFGGLLGSKTSGAMGVSETLMGTAVSGIAASVFLGQPLLILGVTGPNVIFEEALYLFCEGKEMDFLACRVWTGFWIILITFFFVMFEGSVLIRKVTRFTEEIFSILISLIFIVETFKKLAKTFKIHPLLSLGNQILDCVRETDDSNDPTLKGNETLSDIFNGQTDFNATLLDEKIFNDCISKPNTALLRLVFILFFKGTVPIERLS